MSHDTVSTSVVSMPDTQQVKAMLQAHSQTLQTQAPSKRGRPTKLSWTHLCFGVLLCALSGWQSQLDLRRLLCFEGFWHWPAVSLLTRSSHLQSARPGRILHAGALSRDQ
jgi:hypothetical protein